MGGDVTGSFSALFSTLAISNKAFRVGSPACNEGAVVEGGAVSILIISVAA